MISKIKAKFFPKNSQLVVDTLIQKIEVIRNGNETLVLYGSPTEGNWKGIANATVGLFPSNSLEIPQWYSHSVLNEKDTIKICAFINQAKFKKVIISGFAPYFFEWIDSLYHHSEIEIIYHGTISEWHDSVHQEFIGKLIEYGQTKKITRIACVSKGLENVFKKLYDLDSFHQPLADPKIPEGIKKLQLDRTKIHIGVFGADTFNKNLHNQVVAALMIDNTILHVLDASRFAYLQKDYRIIGHGTNLPREQFLSLLASMDINMYMSFNESWGLIAKESEQIGIPAITAFSSDYISIIKVEILKLENEKNHKKDSK